MVAAAGVAIAGDQELSYGPAGILKLIFRDNEHDFDENKVTRVSSESRISSL